MIKLTTSLDKSLFINQRILHLILKYVGIPHLGSMIRLRLISKILEVQDKNLKILDAGCGYGFITKMLAQKGFLVTGVDNDVNRLKVARKLFQNHEIKFLKAGLSNLPFKDRSFDLVVCLEVLEHIKDDTKALKELKRITKSSGKIIVSFPEANTNKVGYKNFGHVRPGYSVEKFQALAKKMGLKIDQFMPFGLTVIGKLVLVIDYNLAKISPFLSSLMYPLLYPPLVFEQHLPFFSNPWNYVAVLSKRNFKNLTSRSKY